MKKLLVTLIAFVMMFGSINVFAEKTESEYNTCISGDIVLNLNDDWQPNFKYGIQHMHLPPDLFYIQVIAVVHIAGNTDAERLSIESAEFPSLTDEIEIDGNGNFDQEFEVFLTDFNSIDSDTINFGAYINAGKGDKTVRVKIGKGELKTDFLINTKDKLDQDNDGVINSLDFAAFKRKYYDAFKAEYEKLDEQESINAYIYNEWYMRDFVDGKDGMSFNAQTHLKAKTDATNITLEITNNGTTKKYEYLPDGTGNTEQIEEFEGVVSWMQSSDIAAYARIKAYKGNREIELLSSLRGRKGGNAVVGDVDGNKYVNSIDFMLMRKYIMGTIDRFSAESGFYCADVDDNKQINAIDFAYVRKYLLGMIPDFPKKSVSISPTNTPVPSTPTPGNGMVTFYYVNNIDVVKNPGVEISIEKSPTNKIWVSAETVCRGPIYADGWAETYFRLSGSAINGVDYEKIDFDYFWRVIGSDVFTPSGDNPRRGFYITPIDTGSDETKDLEIYFGSSAKPAAIIHLVNGNVSPSTPIPSTPTPAIQTPTIPTPTPGNGMVTIYSVNNIDVVKNPGLEVSVEKSAENKIWISAKTECHGPVYADGLTKTYFSLSGSAVNGVDYEKIDFNYFWRVIGSDLFMPTGDNNPKYGFYITPIDTGSDETKDLEIYFGSSAKPAAIIHLTKNLGD